ncbi:MAG: hypothetical protein OYH77_03980 [Pseudomonadota bacterium]|nr:hypothetical protein [Pseudomonadota bacterium]
MSIPLRISVKLLLLISPAVLTPSASADAVDARLKERVEKLYHQRTSDYGWYYRLVFATVGGAIAAQIVQKCEQEQCRDTQINQAIQQRVFHVGKHAAAAATYGVVFAGIMLSAYGGAKFSHFLSKRNISEATKNFINVFVPIVTGMGVFSIGAPLWDPARSFIRRWAFANNQFSNKPDTSTYPSRPELEAYWMEMQRHFSINAQISRNTLSAALVLLTPTLQDARHAYDAGRYEYAAAQIAKSLVQLRYIYSELMPDQPLLVASVRSYFSIVAPHHKQQFKQQIVKIALTLDPRSPTDADFYEGAVQAWF